MREFNLVEFAGFLGEMALDVDVATQHSLTAAAKIVQKQAKAEIGHYQEQMGPFPAWAELADSTKDDRVRKGFTENDPGLRTGEMRESIQNTVGKHEADIGSDDDKLVYFELGTVKQPPRSVLAGALISKEKDVVRAIGGTFVGKLTGEKVFERAVDVIENN